MIQLFLQHTLVASTAFDVRIPEFSIGSGRIEITDIMAFNFVLGIYRIQLLLLG
jgi:hypothetical protein